MKLNSTIQAALTNKEQGPGCPSCAFDRVENSTVDDAHRLCTITTASTGRLSKVAKIWTRGESNPGPLPVRISMGFNEAARC